MVRDVVRSISKVPDQIGREVFIKEAASILEMEPNSLYEELARLQGLQERQRRKKPSSSASNGSGASRLFC